MKRTICRIKNMKRTIYRVAFISVLMLSVLPVGQADTVTIGALKDNTLYEDVGGTRSNGAGQHLFAGVTLGIEVRRGLVAFDIIRSVTAGSTIDAVTLTLNLSRTISGAQTVTLHRVLADWGEGTSDAALNEGQGITAATNDATWIHTFSPTATWTTSGGDFSGVASATQTVNALGPYSWADPVMTADVQLWLDSPGMAFGWIILGNEAGLATTKRFDTKENPTPANRPSLTIEFTPPLSVEDWIDY